MLNASVSAQQIQYFDIPNLCRDCFLIKHNVHTLLHAELLMFHCWNGI